MAQAEWLKLANLVGWETACQVARSLREDSRREGDSIKRLYIETLLAIFKIKTEQQPASSALWKYKIA